jgi:ribosomal-protein-alanine N-acetyltransferase
MLAEWYKRGMASETVLETERLIARKWVIEDAEAAFSIYGDPEVMRFLGSGQPPENVEKMGESLSRIIERDKDSVYGSWALELKETGEVVGAVLLKPLPESKNIEVGWHLAQRHWGKGYATEAARAAVAYGFELGLDTIYAVVFPENTRSLAVTSRLGMEPMGRSTDYYGKELELFQLKRPGNV